MNALHIDTKEYRKTGQRRDHETCLHQGVKAIKPLLEVCNSILGGRGKTAFVQSLCNCTTRPQAHSAFLSTTLLLPEV